MYINEEYQKLRKPIEQWPLDNIQRFQLRCIKRLIERVMVNSPFYEKKFSRLNLSEINTLDDMEKIPFTTKDEIRGDPWILLSIRFTEVAQIHQSTGTTGGEPIYIPYSYEDLYEDLGPEYYPGLVDVKRGDIVINALPYEISSAGLSFHRVFQHACRATVVPVGKGGFYSTPEKAVELMNKLKANILITTPSYAVYLYEVAQQNGLKIGEDIKLKKIWITGEGCSDAFRKRLEIMWDCPVFRYYGSLEAGPIGIECEEKDGYHIAMGHVFLEVVDEDTGKVLEPGNVGEIVITTLTRRAAPLIRYKTGDLGYIEDLPCKCGRTLPMIHLRGRKEELINIGKLKISHYFIEELIMQNPKIGNWYEIKLLPNNTIELKLELSPNIEIDDSISEEIRDKINFALGIDCKIKLVKFNTLPRPKGKVKRVYKEGVA